MTGHVVERGAERAVPGDALGVAQQRQLLVEQCIVVAEVVPNSGNDLMNEPRPALISARPLETWSRMANYSIIRTGS